MIESVIDNKFLQRVLLQILKTNFEIQTYVVHRFFSSISKECAMEAIIENVCIKQVKESVKCKIHLMLKCGHMFKYSGQRLGLFIFGQLHLMIGIADLH